MAVLKVRVLCFYHIFCHIFLVILHLRLVIFLEFESLIDPFPVCMNEQHGILVVMRKKNLIFKHSSQVKTIFQIEVT